MSEYRIGVDLGGTKTEVILLQNKKEIFRKRIKTSSESYNDIVDSIVTLVHVCLTLINNDASIGIGMPGSFTAKGLVKNSNTICLNGKPFKKDLEKKLGQCIAVMNDANCFALSEAIDGAAKNSPVVFGVILGTGVGGGIIVNRMPVPGVNSIAGEWGHNPLPITAPRIDKKERICYCGQKNCIETYLCGEGLSQSYFQITSTKRTAKHIAKMALQGEKAALKVMELYQRQLAASLATVINLLDPNIIVLGGGLSNLPDLAKNTEKYLAKHVFSDVVKTKLVKNHHGDASGVRGAAWLWSTS